MGIEGEVKRERLKGAPMARRPPLDDRELLKLLEAGHGQSESARTLGYPVGTVTARVKKLRDRGILTPGGVVDWEALDTWEREHKPAAYRAKVKASKLPSKPKPEAEEAPRDVESKPEVYQESKLEGLLPELEEIVSWWRERKKALSKPIGVSKKRQTYILSEELIEAVKDYAQRKGIPITEAINEIIRRGLTEG